jgi:hypothetical protein
VRTIDLLSQKTSPTASARPASSRRSTRARIVGQLVGLAVPRLSILTPRQTCSAKGEVGVLSSASAAGDESVASFMS